MINQLIKYKTLLIFFLFILLINNAFAQLNKDRITDSLLLIERIDKSKLKAKDYFKITLYKYSQDSLFSAADYAKKAINLAKEEGDFETLGGSYNIKGYIYLSFGTYLKALDFFSKGEQVGEQYGYPKVVLSSVHGMGRVYNDLGEYDNALKVLQRGVDIVSNDSIPVDYNGAVLYNAIGVSYQKKGNTKLALKYLQKFYDLSLSASDTLSMIYGLVNIGESYRLDSNTQLAIDYFLRAQSLNKDWQDPQAMAAIYGNLGNVYFAKGDLKESIIFLKKSIDVCMKNDGLSGHLLLDYKLIIEEYANMKQYDSAYMYYKKYIVYSDSINELDKTQRASHIRAEYKIEERELEQRELTQKLKNRTLIMIFSIALSIFIILLLILTYSRYKLKNRILKKEKKELSLTVDEKNRELVTRIMNQNRHKVVYEELRRTLLNIEQKNDIDSIKKEVDSLQRKFSQGNKVGMDWESFKLHFEQVHPDFFNKLLKRNPSLTSNDLRLCGFIKMNLSTKDIAKILNISDRAIQTSRYRIKKKLNLAPDVNLIQFILGL